MKTYHRDILINLNEFPDYWCKAFSKRLPNDLQPTHGFTLRQILFALRDMPYKRPSKENTVENCLDEWQGTCSGKHKVAYELLNVLGYEAKLWMAAYKVDFNKNYFSEKLKSLAKNTAVYDIHNFLTCNLTGKDIIIDITFPRKFKSLGFPVTDEWDGEENFILCCIPEHTILIENVDKADADKKRWLEELNSKDGLKIREMFIREMMLAAEQATE